MNLLDSPFPASVFSLLREFVGPHPLAELISSGVSKDLVDGAMDRLLDLNMYFNRDGLIYQVEVWGQNFMGVEELGYEVRENKMVKNDKGRVNTAGYIVGCGTLQYTASNTDLNRGAVGQINWERCTVRETYTCSAAIWTVESLQAFAMDCENKLRRKYTKPTDFDTSLDLRKYTNTTDFDGMEFRGFWEIGKRPVDEKVDDVQVFDENVFTLKGRVET